MILVLDFGSQYTQLIARRVREQHVYCEIHPFNVPLATVEKLRPEGIILSGGPSSVYAEGAPLPDPKLLDVGVPVLGICYGMNVLNFLAGGKVARATHREYGAARITIDDAGDLFADIADVVDGSTVWMSHGDRMETIAPGWKIIAHSGNSPIAACSDVAHRRWGIQFHPEVHHSEQGTAVLRNFIFRICKAEPTWTMENFVGEEVERIRTQVGDDKVICALSGGVDSAVAAAIIDRAVGDRLTCVFVDNGVLRAGEAERVAEAFRGRFGERLKVVDARKQFLDALAGVEDPEKKRKAIGRVFIEVFEAEAKKIPGVAYLAQGTLYPDVIESVSFKGPSATIKSHHNVGGLPERMQLEARRAAARALQGRGPRARPPASTSPTRSCSASHSPAPASPSAFSGPSTEERLFILRAVDTIVVSEIKAAGLYRKVWQSFAVLLPVKTVGVMGDERTYENVIAIRAVESVDGMTADWARLPYDLLAHLSNRIINEVAGVNRVVYDISSKPPATIEWE